MFYSAGEWARLLANQWIDVDLNGVVPGLRVMSFGNIASSPILHVLNGDGEIEGGGCVTVVPLLIRLRLQNLRDCHSLGVQQSWPGVLCRLELPSKGVMW